MIDPEEAKIKGRELVGKLRQKIDKCSWKKDVNDTGAYVYCVANNSARVCVHKDELAVFNEDGYKIMEYVPTTEQASPQENSDAYNLAMLFGKIAERLDAQTAELLVAINKELDALQ